MDAKRRKKLDKLWIESAAERLRCWRINGSRYDGFGLDVIITDYETILRLHPELANLNINDNKRKRDN